VVAAIAVYGKTEASLAPLRKCSHTAAIALCRGEALRVFTHSVCSRTVGVTAVRARAGRRRSKHGDFGPTSSRRRTGRFNQSVRDEGITFAFGCGERSGRRRLLTGLPCRFRFSER
jgi:hypothetical protein